MRTLILGVAAAVAVTALTPALAGKNDRREDYNRYYDQGGNYSGPSWRGDDGRMYCRRRDGTTGLIVGAAIGGLIGNSLDNGRSSLLGTLIGAAAGGAIGREIDRNNVRCR